MIAPYLRKKTRYLKRQLKRQMPIFAVALGTAGVAASVYYFDGGRHTADPETYKPLLNLIAKAESNDNYNAYFGNPGNKEVDFTNMTIAEVLSWQSAYVEQGSPSSAVGRYQIINTTLEGLVNELGLDRSSKFSRSMQDRMAVALIERRGAEAYVNSELTPEQFAASLAKEWAALPRATGDNPERSYYAHDGINRSSVKVGEILAVIKMIQP